MIFALLLTLAVGLTGYGAGQHLKKDIPRLKPWAVYYFNEFKLAAADVKTDALSAMEPGLRVTHPVYGAYQDYMSIDIKTNGTIVSDITLPFIDAADMESVAPGKDVLLFRRNGELIKDPAKITDVSLQPDGTRRLTLILPTSVLADGIKRLTGHIVTREAMHVKLLPASALVTDAEDGTFYVWVATAQDADKKKYTLTRRAVSPGLRNDTLFEADHRIALDDIVVMNPDDGWDDTKTVSQIALRDFERPAGTAQDVLREASYMDNIQETRTVILQIQQDRAALQGFSCGVDNDPLKQLTDNPPPPTGLKESPPPPPPRPGCGTCGMVPPTPPAETAATGV